jgi:hypothetical protein
MFRVWAGLHKYGNYDSSHIGADEKLQVNRLTYLDPRALIRHSNVSRMHPVTCGSGDAEVIMNYVAVGDPTSPALLLIPLRPSLEGKSLRTIAAETRVGRTRVANRLEALGEPRSGTQEGKQRRLILRDVR